jgi:NDP-sugar pyrophosphorylase family protein
MNIVIPMAGRGSRFASVGYDLPKPLIDVGGQPMIARVVENLRPSRPHRFVFLVLQEHLNAYDVAPTLDRLAPGCVIIPVSSVTEGAACTVLLARDVIDSNEPLMIANSDQWIDFDIDGYLTSLDEGNLDGLIMTMWADHPKWSYVRFAENGNVREVVEKEVVSNSATVGIYNFARGADYVWAADEMISRDQRVSGEFYVAPTYNALIEHGARIGTVDVGAAGAGMYGLGTPEDLAEFLASPVVTRLG